MENTQTTLRDQISSAVEAVETPETVVETPVESTPAEKIAVELKKDETGRLHAKDGKFAEKKEEAGEPIKEGTETRPPRPSSWKKDYEKDWETLNPRLAAYIDQREKEYAKGVSTYKGEWDRAKPILDAISPYQQMLQQSNMRPEQVINNLFMRHQQLVHGSPQQKLQAFAQFAQEYGVPLQALLQPQQGQQINPQFQLQQLLQQAVAPIKQEFAQYKSAQEQREAAQIQKEIEAFSKDKPHYEELKQTMAEVLEKGLATDLDGAYSIAMRMPQHDDIWTAMQDEKRKTEEAKRAQEAAQAAKAAKAKAVSIKSSSPGNAQSNAPKNSLRDSITEQVNANFGRV